MTTTADRITYDTEDNIDYKKALDADLGGYRLQDFREAGGEETRRFEATITKDGIPVARVSNDGHGGCNVYQSVDGNEERAQEFHTFAQEWSSELGFAPDMPSPSGSGSIVLTPFQVDFFVEHLVTCDNLSHKLKTVFIIDGDSPFEPNGMHRETSTNASREDLESTLRKVGITGLRIWDRQEYRFV